jgi:7,8-dihydropterin-6-yl-methyl-4-(beta-D-ribofuranosyl)aminobenzene 5'-phosphate synthase
MKPHGNIVEQARRVCNEERVVDVIGGFHLLDRWADEKRLVEIVGYFGNIKPGRIYPCHCTSLRSKLALARVCPIREAKVGTVLEFS